jgi:hypothetical protein
MLKIFLFFINFIFSNSLILNPKFNLIDIDHLKVIANSWRYSWGKNPNSLSYLRQKECKDIISLSYTKENEYIALLWSQNYNLDSYLIILKELNENINLIALLENPHNEYEKTQIDDLLIDLISVCEKSKKILNLFELKKWSHGMYLYKYMNN